MIKLLLCLKAEFKKTKLNFKCSQHIVSMKKYYSDPVSLKILRILSESS